MAAKSKGNIQIHKVASIVFLNCQNSERKQKIEKLHEEEFFVKI